MGTPEAMYSSEGQKVWSCELNSYGKVRNFQGEYVTECPFRYQGQYHDSETGLYYNRFRYYSPDEGVYISQDPIGLNGNNPTIYAYVGNNNAWIDIFGLDLCDSRKTAKEQSEPEVENRLRQRYPNSDYEILTEPRIYLLDENGNVTSRYSNPDFMVIDRQSGAIVDIVDAKNGGGQFSQNQADLHANGGVFNGSSRSETRPKSSGSAQIPSGTIRIEHTNF